MPSLSATVAGKASRVLGLSALLWLAAAAWAAEGTVVSIRESSPTQYTVVEGDTLWDIAGMFLEQPWLWPEVWQINPQIDNPDLIYPGDVIELAYIDGNPVLRLSRAGAGPASDAAVSESDLRTVRLSPRVRREPLLSPIAAIPLDLISSYLSGNSVLTAEQFDTAPYVLGDRVGRTMYSAGDEILARGEWAAGEATYDIVRKGRKLEDPDTGAKLGYEALLMGTAILRRADLREAELVVSSNEQEVRAGDRLIPHIGATLDASYLPQPPPFTVNAAIVTIGTGRIIGGKYDTLILNVGANQGIAVSHLLTVQEPEQVIEDEFGDHGAWQKFRKLIHLDSEVDAKFAGEKIGTVLVYRVFDNASLAIVLESDEELRMNDRVVTP
ncbi:MAG: hypothetical protein RLZZ227_972 [Pseudomonadota bacterium]